MMSYFWYVFAAYGCVLVFLLAQWFFPWRRWRQYLNQNKHS